MYFTFSVVFFNWTHIPKYLFTFKITLFFKVHSSNYSSTSLIFLMPNIPKNAETRKIRSIRTVRERLITRIGSFRAVFPLRRIGQNSFCRMVKYITHSRWYTVILQMNLHGILFSLRRRIHNYLDEADFNNSETW